MEADADEESIPTFPRANSLGFGGINRCFFTGSCRSIDVIKEQISFGSGLI